MFKKKNMLSVFTDIFHSIQTRLYVQNTQSDQYHYIFSFICLQPKTRENNGNYF